MNLLYLFAGQNLHSILLEEFTISCKIVHIYTRKAYALCVCMRMWEHCSTAIWLSHDPDLMFYLIQSDFPPISLISLSIHYPAIINQRRYAIDL